MPTAQENGICKDRRDWHEAWQLPCCSFLVGELMKLFWVLLLTRHLQEALANTFKMRTRAHNKANAAQMFIWLLLWLAFPGSSPVSNRHVKTWHHHCQKWRHHPHPTWRGYQSWSSCPRPSPGGSEPVVSVSKVKPYARVVKCVRWDSAHVDFRLITWFIF